eukprot:gene15583-21682_t
MSNRKKRSFLKKEIFLGSSEDRVETAIHACGVTAIAIISLKLALPIFGKIGKLLSGGGGKKKQAPAQIQTGPSEDKWHVVDSPPPQIPSDYKELASGVLPCSVQDFYNKVVSSHSDYFQHLHATVGKHRDVTASGWKASGSPALDDGNMIGDKEVFDFALGTSGTGGFMRTMTFIQPKKPPASVDADCVQRQQFCVYKGDVMVFSTAMNMLNIPFKDCFTVNTAWIIKPEGDGKSCSISVSCKDYIAEAASGLGSGAPLGKGVSVATRGSGAASSSPATGGGGGGGDGTTTGELTRHVRIMFVVLVIVGSLVHQLSMHQQLGRPSVYECLGQGGGRPRHSETDGLLGLGTLRPTASLAQALDCTLPEGGDPGPQEAGGAASWGREREKRASAPSTSRTATRTQSHPGVAPRPKPSRAQSGPVPAPRKCGGELAPARLAWEHVPHIRTCCLNSKFSFNLPTDAIDYDSNE